MVSFLLPAIAFRQASDVQAKSWALFNDSLHLASDSVKRYKEAEAAIDESIRLHLFPSHMQYVYQAHLHALAGDLDGAIAAYRRLMKIGWVRYQSVQNYDDEPLALRTDPRWLAIVEELRRKQDRMRREQDPGAFGLSFTLAPRLVKDWADDLTVSDADLARRLAGFHAYVQPRRTGAWMLGTHRLATPGAAPLDVDYWVWVPKGYRADRPTPTLVYSHQGWFYNPNARPWSYENDLFDDPPRDEAVRAGFIEVMPLGSRKTDGSTPQGVEAVRQILVDVKRVLNVDDDRAYLVGHSNGGSLAYRTAGLDPTPYAAFVPLNGWPDPSIPMANFRNRPILALSAEGDTTFPNADVRAIHDAVAGLAPTWDLETVPGGDHALEPFVDAWMPRLFARMAATRRGSFAPERVWEGRAPGGVDWLGVEALDLARPRAAWQALIATPSVKTHGDGQGGSPPGPHTQDADCGMARASYSDNAFTVETSRVAKVALWISPKMIDLSRPVRVVVDGKEAFSGLVKIDRKAMAERFLDTFDRAATPVARIEVSVPAPDKAP